MTSRVKSWLKAFFNPSCASPITNCTVFRPLLPSEQEHQPELIIHSGSQIKSQQVVLSSILHTGRNHQSPFDHSIILLYFQVHPRGHNDYARFFEGILATEAGDYFDVIGFHSYEFYPQQSLNPKFGQYYSKDWNTAWNTTGPVLITKTQYIASLLLQYGVSGKDLYSTESAVINSDPSHNLSGGICKPFDSDYERTKASHIVQTYTYAKVLNLKTNIYFSTVGWRCSALLEGYQNTHVLPAYYAYKFAGHTIGPADFAREITNYTNVQSVEFTKYKSSTKLWVVWSLDGASHSITLPNTPSKIWDMAGVAKTVSGKSFNVTLVPHYIQY